MSSNLTYKWRSGTWAEGLEKLTAGLQAPPRLEPSGGILGTMLCVFRGTKAGRRSPRNVLIP